MVLNYWIGHRFRSLIFNFFMWINQILILIVNSFNFNNWCTLNRFTIIGLSIAQRIEFRIRDLKIPIQVVLRFLFKIWVAIMSVKCWRILKWSSVLSIFCITLIPLKDLHWIYWWSSAWITVCMSLIASFTYLWLIL